MGWEAHRIDPTQDWGKCQAVVNKVMNLRGP
jgi:hypothetical protein